MDILAKENVDIDSLAGHGGLFKAPWWARNIWLPPVMLRSPAWTLPERAAHTA